MNAHGPALRAIGMAEAVTSQNATRYPSDKTYSQDVASLQRSAALLIEDQEVSDEEARSQSSPAGPVPSVG